MLAQIVQSTNKMISLRKEEENSSTTTSPAHKYDEHTTGERHAPPQKRESGSTASVRSVYSVNSVNSMDDQLADNHVSPLEGGLKRRHRVSFTDVNIREYNQVIGDSPVCSSGCPVR